jgi:D-threo-aldose 1-dehydrogenase
VVRTHGKRADEHLRAFLDTGYRAMADLKASGAVDAIGIGVNEPAICEQLLREVDLDVVFLAGRLTLLDQSALDRVVPLCRSRGVRFIAGAPYNSGILASPTREQQAPRYDYTPPPPALMSRAIEIEHLCARFRRFTFRSGVAISAAPCGGGVCRRRAGETG